MTNLHTRVFIYGNPDPPQYNLRYPFELQKEASEVFFAATKLFQSKDPHLRRMVYLCIKDICPGSDEVIIVTSSLMKDMNSKVDLYRANAVRVLCQIVDAQLLAQIERYLKQAVVDKSPVVAASGAVPRLDSKVPD
jgi:coatomer protein complex subunit gamma